MGLRFKDQSIGECFFVTTSFSQQKRFGNINEVYQILAESLTFCINKYEAKLPAFVFMPSHIHILLVIDGGKLGSFMRDFKKYVAQKGIRRCGIIDATIWQQRYDRVAVYTEDVFRQKLEYIHRNPVKARLVENEHEWEWSSASAYLESGERLVPVWKDWFF